MQLKTSNRRKLRWNINGESFKKAAVETADNMPVIYGNMLEKLLRNTLSFAGHNSPARVDCTGTIIPSPKPTFMKRLKKCQRFFVSNMHIS